MVVTTSSSTCCCSSTIISIGGGGGAATSADGLEGSTESGGADGWDDATASFSALGHAIALDELESSDEIVEPGAALAHPRSNAQTPIAASPLVLPIISFYGLRRLICRALSASTHRRPLAWVDIVAKPRQFVTNRLSQPRSGCPRAIFLRSSTLTRLLCAAHSADSTPSHNSCSPLFVSAASAR